MLKQIIVQSLNGFSMNDIPFLFLQLSVSALLAIAVRVYWKKGLANDEEKSLVKYLVPIQVLFTTMAVFSWKSPWIMVLFGLFTLVPIISTVGFSLRSKVFYLICIFIAFGCGAANLMVTLVITTIIILPCLHFYKSE